MQRYTINLPRKKGGVNMFNKKPLEKTEVFNMNIGKNISALRKERNMTQEELANALGVSAQAVSKWENENSCPDISLLVKIADLFSVTVDELLRSNADELNSKASNQKAEIKSTKRKINISVEQLNGKKTEVNIPFGLVNLGMKFGSAFGLDDDTVQKIHTVIDSPELANNEIISVDGENGEHITIKVL